MIISKLKMNLKRSGITPVIDAAQGDVLTRALEISLYDGADKFLLPENLAILIRYKKADGKGGEYDTLPDNRPAWSSYKNILTVLLAPQVLTFPGSVSMTITLVENGTQISTFPLWINVLPEAKSQTAASEDYFCITGFLTAPGNATVGQFLKITAVNSEGRVTQVESGLPEQIPSDWAAAAEQPGYILNRPFYSQISEAMILPETNPIYDADEGMSFLSDTLQLTMGLECNVNWNGADYRCTVQDLSLLAPGMVALGNLPVMFPDVPADAGLSGNGEPFVILSGPEEIMAELGAGTIFCHLDGSSDLTVSITGQVETIIPIPAKYLANVRGQNKYTIDLDTKTSNVSVEKLITLDAGEIQNSLTVIYEGVPHSLSVVNIQESTLGGAPVYWIDFAFNHSLGLLVNFRMHSSGGLSIQRTASNVLYNFSTADCCLYLKKENESTPHWGRIRESAFPGILLESSTSGSTKRFWITVDDNGVLTATQN